MKPTFEKTRTVHTPVPVIDHDKCTFCRKCEEICRFKAIAVIKKTVLTFPELCHSCGGCVEICPEGAITETGRELGVIETGKAGEIRFAHGKIRVGEAMAPPLINKVRAYRVPERVTIIDAPPGTSCPVIAAMKGTDFVLMVTEPTPFGLHDLALGVAAVKLLGIPCGLVINRSDIGTDSVYAYAEEESLPIFMEIPFDRKIAEIYSRGGLVAEEIPEYKPKFLDLFTRIQQSAKRIVR